MRSLDVGSNERLQRVLDIASGSSGAADETSLAQVERRLRGA